jgi:hypothetical protein
MNRKYATLFSNLCCSHCKSGFDEDSVTIKREEAGLIVFNLACKRCGKNFGAAFLGFSGLELQENAAPLEVQEGPEPISYDDVLDAHRFIQELEGDWQKHLPN